MYQVALSAIPSGVWRAAFVRPPASLGRAPFSPAGIDLQGAAVVFRAAPSKVREWNTAALHEGEGRARGCRGVRTA